MRKEVTIFVLILLFLSTFTVAQGAVDSQVSTSEQPTISEAQTCGFWCKINTFLFGSAENRAGAGWFDRKEALVGKGK